MQPADVKLYKNSLLLGLRHYSTTVSNMEQTILLPSLLRDVPSDDIWDRTAAEETCRDLYENYLMLKAIRATVESGLLPPDEHNTNAALNKSMEPLLETDPEVLFYFHLKGLFSLLSNLTKKSQNLTDKYKNIIGMAN